jgi:hypothetical protein
VKINANNYVPNAENSIFAVCQTRCSSIRKIPLLFKKAKDGLVFAYVLEEPIWFVLSGICKSKYSAQLSSRVFHPLFAHKLHVTRGLSLAYAVTMVTSVVLFHRISLFVILPLDSDTESKRKCKSGN